MRDRISLYSFISKRVNLILAIDIIVVILFAIIYYNLQFWIKNSFVRSSEETKLLPQGTKFTFLECLHFSVVTQSTLGYGDMIPTGNIPVVINTIQIISLYAIPFLVFAYYKLGVKI